MDSIAAVRTGSKPSSVPCAATGVEYVCVDLTNALDRGGERESRMVPLAAALVEHLLLGDPEHPTGPKGS